MYENKKILITGAASGIGKLLATQFAKYQCQLILVDYNSEALEATKDELSNASISQAAIDCFVCDLNQEDLLMQTIEKIKDQFQYIDILVNNAGIVSGKPLVNLSNDDIKRTFMVNTIAPFILCREFIKEMIERDQGQIINLCSASSYVGVPKLSDYAASKAAILSMDESIRLELKQMKSHVVTTAFCPYYINTGMFDGVKTRFSFLLPILKPEYVCQRLMKAIAKKEKRVIIPPFVYLSFVIKVFPPAIFDALLSFFGINSSMDEFKGRKKS